MVTTEVVNPATEKVVATVELADLAATGAAVDRAVRASESWRAVAPGDRARLLRRFAEAVDGDLEGLARLEVENSGHTLGNARWEAGNVRDVLHFAAGMPERLSGRQIPVAGGLDVTFHEPLGVVGVIVPWNFPMPIAAWGFAPALAAGNAVVLKPAELTPLTALRLAELARAAGIPDDVFQVLPGKGSVVGERFVTHPAVRKVVFTGSTEVGKRIMAGCAEQVKRVTLELGGKSANIVFADADLERAAATAPYGVFDNAGQDCCARSRILVQRSVFDRFLELFEPAVRGVKVGDPGADGTEMGPLISAAHRERVAGFVTPREVAFTGDCPSGPGFWYPPTVVLPASPTARVLHRGGVRSGGDGTALRGRGRRAAPGQRHRIRSVRLDLDQRPRPRPAREPRGGGREPVGELALVGAVLDAVRRVQTVRARPRTRPRRRAGVHRDQERLPRHRLTGQARRR